MTASGTASQRGNAAGLGRATIFLRSLLSSTRLSFIMQLGSRALMSIFSLIWTPLLLRAMGAKLNGIFLTFQGMATLGGLSDLGMGGAVNIEVGRLLGQGRKDQLRAFLAAARAAFLVITVVVAVVFLVSTPRLFSKLGFNADPGVGSLLLLACIGAVAVGLLITHSYISNLNYGCGNVAGPIVPTLVFMQLAVAAHYILARQHAPLWIQYTPYLGSALAVQAVIWWMVRLSRPELAELRPLRFGGAEIYGVAAKSGWLYLFNISAGVSIAISTMLITGAFGAGMVPVYQYNNRLCELAKFVVASASLASMPKITQWISSPEAHTRERGMEESLRLAKFQTLFGCLGAIVYVLVNDWFIGIWLGKQFRIPLALQAAFAAHLGVTAAGLTGFELAPRCSEAGVRVGGGIAVVCSLLNLGLAWVAAKNHSLLGIALASLLAQSAVVLALGFYSSRKLKVSWWALSLRNFVVAILTVALALLARRAFLFSLPAAAGTLALLAVCFVMLVMFVLHLNGDDLRRETDILQSMLGKTKPAAPEAK